MYISLFKSLTIFILSRFVIDSKIASAVFPNGRCYTNGCIASPYDVKWYSLSPGSFCFKVYMKQCSDPTRYKCCEVLGQSFHKIVFPINPICRDAFKMVTINGIKKNGGVFLDSYTENNGQSRLELRITSLNMQPAQATSSLFCINFDQSSLCRNVEIACKDLDGLCKYAIFDPYEHFCCPTCTMVTVPSPPSSNPPSTPSIPSAPPTPSRDRGFSPPPPPSPVPNSPPPPPQCSNSLCQSMCCQTCKSNPLLKNQCIKLY